jgi:diguanylate cyclase (GGDEF)-like protein
VSAPTDDSPIKLQSLSLDDARALLKHDAQNAGQEPDETDAAYLQRLIDGLCALSLMDPLTGLHNRRHFLTVLERSIDVVARSGESVLLLLIDIDHFKSINDRHGHLAGDQVLRDVARCLAHCLRPMDTVARYGGEEFAVILPSCRPLFGLAVAERIRQTIGALPIHVTPQLTLQITISIGGAYAPEWVRSTPDLWIERADQQLYRAKAEGRDRVCLDQPREFSVSAEEKGLLFGHLVMDDPGAAEDTPPDTPVDAAGNPTQRVNV